MSGHGHYNIPLLGGDETVIGVIVLYLEDHHRPHPEEETFTDMLGQAVASILTHRNLDLQSEIGRIQLQQAHVDMMSKLVSAAEYRDHETGFHLKRMSRYSVIIGQTIGLSHEELDLLGIAAPMHDIGKVGIPDEILMKPGKLTDDEYAVMKRHPEIGANILSGDNPLMQASHDIALGHHEKWDGSGYPRGLVGEETPLFARICALADVFDALTTRRPYKEPWPLERTLAFIREQSGSHFDPNLVEALNQSLDEILEVASLFGDDDDDSHLFGTEGLPRTSSDGEPGHLERLRKTDAPGVETVARQHRFIMDITQRLETAAISMDTREFFDCLNALQANLSVYLVNEENLMRQIDYPEAERHEDAHRTFAALTSRMLADLETSPLAASFAAPRLIGEWVRDHVEGHGSELLGFLRDRALQTRSRTGQRSS
ncbi:MAG TPA: HD domain-containing protein [Deltaproteobacteria bacterium]|nr:HD domain-containing protein [Deltaproteobacteria bacterium]